MAESKLTFRDPFAEIGNRVYGERFVGRKEHVVELQKYCTTQNYSIVGLPKIGKTSLAYHSVIHQKDRVVSDKPFVPIFFNVGTSDSSYNFFKRLVKDVCRNISDVLEEKDAGRSLLKDGYEMVVEDNFDTDDIQSFFKDYVYKIPINLVIVFDEFDTVRDFFKGYDWSLLREILVENVHGIINSKRTINVLENGGDRKDGPPSKFHESIGGYIRLKYFNENDLSSYWQRLEPFFNEIGLTINEEYIKEAEFYVGRHPYLLDVYNSFKYKNFEKNQQIQISELRAKIKESFDLMLEVLKTEDLLKSAVQAIIVPVDDLKEEEKDRLENYGFIKSIPVETKMKMLGADFGYSFVDATGNECAFMAPSEYFTLYMKGKFINEPDYQDTWGVTVIALRQLMAQFFIDNFGGNWENEDFSNHEVIRTAIDEMKLSLIKDKHDDIGISPLINYLMEKNIVSILYDYWNSFADIFSPISKKDFFQKIEYVKAVRNHPAHHNDKYLTEKNKERAKQYSEEIKEKLDAWLTNPDKQKLTIQIPQKKIIIRENDTLEGIIAKEEKGFGHIITDPSFPFDLKIEDPWYDKSAGNIGKKARFVVVKNIKGRYAADKVMIIQ